MKTHHLTTYEPYSVAAYTPDISGLSSAFDPLVGKWKEEFAEHLTVKLREVFARTGKNASNHLRPLLDKEEDVVSLSVGVLLVSLASLIGVVVMVTCCVVVAACWLRRKKKIHGFYLHQKMVLPTNSISTCD